MVSSKFIYVCLLSFLLISCEELIDIDLNEKEPKVVINAELTDLSNTQQIRISKTVNFNATTNSTPVNDAQVKVTDSEGKTYVFSSNNNGVYRSGQFRPKAGLTYYLEAIVDGQIYTATSYMPTYIGVDSIGLSEDIVFDDTLYSVTMKFNDPVGVENFYKYNISVNNKPFEFSRVFSDKFNDGLFVTHQLSDRDNSIVKGDTVNIQRMVIDKNVFKYWNELQSINPGSAAPANPTSNISNGALGYFNVASSKIYGYRITFDD